MNGHAGRPTDRLVPLALQPLPLGRIKPAGWLLRQLRIQRDGLSGHLDEFWPDVKDSGWIGGTAEGWERGPYWLDGAVPLAWLLDDETMKAKVIRWMDYILEHGTGGWLGPVQECSGKHKPYDTWPAAVVLKALTQYAEATGDARVVPAMRGLFAALPSLLEKYPLDSWAMYRAQDLILSIQWLSDRSDDAGERRRLGTLMDKVKEQSFDWAAHFRSFPFTKRLRQGGTDMRSHVVNNAMAVKAAAVLSRRSGRAEDLQGVGDAIRLLDRFHGQATGVFSGDEHLAGLNPSQGTELCAVVETMYSLEILLAVTGDPSFADRLERIAFNALPATFTRDMWAHQYDQQVNQAVCRVSEERVYTTNGPDANIFGLEPNYGCCTANMHQGWPKLVSHLWMGVPGGGLALLTAAPAAIDATVPENGGEVAVHVEVSTAYPFDGNVDIVFSPARPMTFPFLFRMPGWADGAEVTVCGKKAAGVAAGSFLRIERTWKDGDRVRAVFPMKPRIERRPSGAACVLRGPLVFSLAVEEDWKILRGTLPYADREVHPASPWNYALREVDGRIDVDFLLADCAGTPFSRSVPPVAGKATGVRIPGWKIARNAAEPPPVKPDPQGSAPEPITLIPYGCTGLRITEFPVSAERSR